MKGKIKIPMKLATLYVFFIFLINIGVMLLAAQIFLATTTSLWLSVLGIGISILLGIYSMKGINYFVSFKTTKQNGIF
jgi:hypothetical protein